MTKEDKVNLFSEELQAIPREDIRTWVSRCIEIFPDYFFEVGASSTGKHHPFWSKGPGGTYRHTRALVRIAREMSGTFAKGDNTVLSRALAGGILHDSCKYGLTYDVRLYDLHPYMPRALFKMVPYDCEEEDREVIFRAVEAHMGSVEDGSWSLLPYVTINTLREEKVAHIVHVADYIVSREDYVDPRFTEHTEGPKAYDLYDDNTILGFFYARLLYQVSSPVAASIVQDADMANSIIMRVRALKKSGEKMSSLYNYDDIMKTIDSNIEWMIEAHAKEVR